MTAPCPCQQPGAHPALRQPAAAHAAIERTSFADQEAETPAPATNSEVSLAEHGAELMQSLPAKYGDEVLRRAEGESLEAWDQRREAAWRRAQNPAKSIAQMTPAEQAAALDAISRPQPRPVVAPFDGMHLRDMSPHQRAEAARQMGLSDIFPTFR